MVGDGVAGDAYECPFQRKDCNDYCGIYDKGRGQCSLISIAEASMGIATNLKDMMERKEQMPT
jgi:hypothetical protein